jgi:hypothetical protein
MTKAQRLHRTQWVVGSLGVLAIVASGVFAHWGWGVNIRDGGRTKLAQVIVVFLWTIVPPMWFWIEYNWLFKPAYSLADKDRFDGFKYQQDLSSKIWIAAVSGLLMLYFWKDIARI